MAKKRNNRRSRKSPSGDFMTQLRPGVAPLQTEIFKREHQLSRCGLSVKRIQNLLDSNILMLEYKAVGDSEVAVIGVEPVQQRSQIKTDAVAEEMVKLRKDRDLKLVEIERLTAELREARIALARVEIDEWRSIGSISFLGRLFRQLEKIFSKLRADSKCAAMPGRASA